MTREQRRLDEHLRCRCCRRVWLDEIARERCRDPAWRRILIAADECETSELNGVEDAGPTHVAGLVCGWQRIGDAAA